MSSEMSRRQGAFVNGLRSAARFVASAVAVLAVLGVGGALQTRFLPPWSYSIASDAVRMFMFAPFGMLIILTKLAHRKWPTLGMTTIARSFLVGSVAGLGLYLATFLIYATEQINGAWDATARDISLKVVALNEYQGKHPYRRLVVKNFSHNRSGSEIFWGGDYPVGWDDPRNCLLARTGKGTLGLRWVAEERIGPCEAFLSKH